MYMLAEYQWYQNNSPIPGETYPVLYTESRGLYFYKVSGMGIPEGPNFDFTGQLMFRYSVASFIPRPSSLIRRQNEVKRNAWYRKSHDIMSG